MNKKDKALLAEALSQICAYVGVIASLFGDDAEARSRDRPEARKQPQEPIPTEEPTDTTPGLICAADVPDSEPADDTPEPMKPTDTGEAATKDPEPSKGKQEAQNIPLSPSYEQVRKLLAEKARTGYRAEVKALLTKHGVKQLSDITDPAEYYEIMVEAGGIGNG
jgi:hypothetical protein